MCMHRYSKQIKGAQMTSFDRCHLLSHSHKLDLFENELFKNINKHNMWKKWIHICEEPKSTIEDKNGVGETSNFRFLTVGSKQKSIISYEIK